jgi:hypothetical protein
MLQGWFDNSGGGLTPEFGPALLASSKRSRPGTLVGIGEFSSEHLRTMKRTAAPERDLMDLRELGE